MYLNIKKRKSRWLSILLLIFLFGDCNVQFSKQYPGPDDVYYENSERPEVNCEDPSHYIPDTNYLSHYPVRVVRVNLHFMNNSDSTTNFNGEEGRQYAIGMIYNANLRLRENKKMNLPVGNNTPVLPPLVQFELSPDTSIPGDDGIYFHYDNELTYVNTKERGPTLFTSRHYEKYGKRKGEVINVFLMEHHPDSLLSPTYKNITGGVGTGPWAKVLSSHYIDTMVFYTQEDGTPVYYGAWFMARSFNHELGHCLGLPHTWRGHDRCDDTPVHPNCWNRSETPPCDKEISNNMMDYNLYQCALTPCQIGTIHRNLSVPGKKYRDFLNNYCDLNTDYDVVIYRGQDIHWKGHKDLKGNIIINSGGSLTLYCSLGLPERAKIIVKSGGQLILDQATITNRCGEQWDGIEIWSSGNKKGRVIFRNDPVLKNVRHPVHAEEEGS